MFITVLHPVSRHCYGLPFHTELDTTPAVLALALATRNPNTSIVILGAIKPEQILENLMKKLTPEILEIRED
ncbi:hypothetical protein D9758_010989 [Tetrapyrgos nigripes]|uniref:Uncharacterized protein n=1 Tax=Tetrapyrgos nigripes TaxID=182062 RepID=A0A8H5GHZ9_9AGAR|nr:hypothetical protein D9758_010989 [Tetrapyrgos nigripes]